LFFFTLDEGFEMYMPKVSTGEFEKCPEGNHLAVCYEVIDLGTQEVTWEGETRYQRKIWIGWETSSEQMEDGKPYVIGRRYTLSSHEKSTLRKDLESWRGKKFSDDDIAQFNIRNLIGCACFLNVVHAAGKTSDRIYANVTNVVALPKGTASPAMINSPVFLSLTQEEYDPAVFELISERMQEMIKTSPEWQALNESEEGETDESSPF
jgi:hypothetical protein